MSIFLRGGGAEAPAPAAAPEKPAAAAAEAPAPAAAPEDPAAAEDNDTVMVDKSTIGENAICRLKETIQILLMILAIALIIFSVPVVPFLYISYLGFYGKYGIVKQLKNFRKSM